MNLQRHGRPRRAKRQESRITPIESHFGPQEINLHPEEETASLDECAVACPLFVKDPAANFRCIQFKFTRPADIAQHIRRAHLLFNYCAVCYEGFATEDGRDEHTRLRQCTQRAPPPDVVLPGKLVGVPRTGTLESKWNELWKSLYPDEEPSSTPFMHGDCRDALRVIRQMERNLSSAGLPTSPFFEDRLVSLEDFYPYDTNAVRMFLPQLQLPALGEPMSSSMPPETPIPLSQQTHEGLMMDDALDSMIGMDEVSFGSFHFHDFPDVDYPPPL